MDSETMRRSLEWRDQQTELTALTAKLTRIGAALQDAIAADDVAKMETLLQDVSSYGATMAACACACRKTMEAFARRYPDATNIPEAIAEMRVAWETGEPSGNVQVTRYDAPDSTKP